MRRKSKNQPHSTDSVHRQTTHHHWRIEKTWISYYLCITIISYAHCNGLEHNNLCSIKSRFLPTSRTRVHWIIRTVHTAIQQIYSVYTIYSENLFALYHVMTVARNIRNSKRQLMEADDEPCRSRATHPPSTDVLLAANILPLPSQVSNQFLITMIVDRFILDKIMNMFDARYIFEFFICSAIKKKSVQIICLHISARYKERFIQNCYMSSFNHVYFHSIK